MQLDSNLTLDQILDLEPELARRKQELAAQQESTDRANFMKKFVLHGWTPETFGWSSNASNTAPSAKGRTIPTPYYDAAAGKGWTLHGNAPTEAMRTAREFDKANPNATPKQMDQFRIPDDKAKEIALKIKKDVRTISGAVIKYNDLIAESSNQPSEQMAA